LRYTEFGGYYVDPRGRRITADLIDQDWFASNDQIPCCPYLDA
jgi:hypothetical protein